MQKIQLKNSTIIFIGFLLVLAGVSLGCLEYFNEKKLKVFDKMNILLFESEMPGSLSSDEELEQDIDDPNDIGIDVGGGEDDVGGGSENPTPVNPSNPTNPSTPSKPKKPRNYNYIGVLEIPKLNLKRGFLDLKSKYNNVNYNITVINGSSMPDTENNNLILAAHSGNCSVCYFATLYKLSVGDKASVYYNKIKYNYKIVKIYEVKKTGQVAIYRDYTKNVLTLITCTKNSNTKQTVYILELENKEKY